MSIQFIDLKAQYQHLKADIDARIHAVLDHGTLSACATVLRHC